MRSIDDIFKRLSRSPFRCRFSLSPREQRYFLERGMAQILEHAAEFIDKRLVPANPTNDGKQTPMRGHPVFVAQHATATCCRSCLADWHDIPEGCTMGPAQRAHVLAVLERWLATSVDPLDPPERYDVGRNHPQPPTDWIDRPGRY